MEVNFSAETQIKLDSMAAAQGRPVDVLIKEAVARLLDYDGWYFWQGNAAGEPIAGTGVVKVEPTAHRGHFSVAISGTTSFANLAKEAKNQAMD